MRPFCSPVFAAMLIKKRLGYYHEGAYRFCCLSSELAQDTSQLEYGVIWTAYQGRGIPMTQQCGGKLSPPTRDGIRNCAIIPKLSAVHKAYWLGGWLSEYCCRRVTHSKKYNLFYTTRLFCRCTCCTARRRNFTRRPPKSRYRAARGCTAC